jgi:hypothetical protein
LTDWWEVGLYLPFAIQNQTIVSGNPRASRLVPESERFQDLAPMRVCFCFISWCLSYSVWVQSWVQKNPPARKGLANQARSDVGGRLDVQCGYPSVWPET